MSGVQSIERAFLLLRALAIGPAGVTDLADRSTLPKSTVARLLGALETEGAVQQLEVGGEYQLGPGLIDLAGAAAPGRNLIVAARPHLLELTEQTNETTGIGILDQDSVLYLDHVESEEEVQVRSWTGEAVALNLVSSGFVLLSGMPEEEVERYLATPLTRETSASLIDPTLIRDRIAETAKLGYVWVNAEFDESINSVAAPVRDGSGEIAAAIHIQGPSYRFPAPGQTEAIGELIKDTATRLSAQLA